MLHGKLRENALLAERERDMRGWQALAVAALGLALAGCAGSSPGAISANDPLEPMNRAVFRFNETFDKYVVLPAAGLYLQDLPVPLRKGLHNTVANLDLPVTFTNDILQGEISHAGETLVRFVFNSTVGLGGIMDVATPAG